MNVTQKAIAVLTVCLMQACAGSPAIDSSAEGFQAENSVAKSSKLTAGSNISVEGDTYSVISSYFSALGRHCALTLTRNSVSATTKANGIGAHVVRFCLEPNNGEYVRIRSLSKE